MSNLNTPFYDIFIISNENKYLMLFNNLNKLACLISAHIYLYMAAYLSDNPKPNDILYNMDIYFEIFFAFSMAI